MTLAVGGRLNANSFDARVHSLNGENRVFQKNQLTLGYYYCFGYVLHVKHLHANTNWQCAIKESNTFWA